jgi:hypothetical protein
VSIQRWPYGSFSEHARSPSNWSESRFGSVAPAASALGYFDQAHVIKAFRAVIGRSAAEYAAVAA